MLFRCVIYSDAYIAKYPVYQYTYTYTYNNNVQVIINTPKSLFYAK